MTTKDFIKKALTNDTSKDFCSSVSRVGDTVYSYGYHYPLAKIINNKVYVNTRGYSSTTARHIHWAFQAASELGLTAYGVPLTDGDGLTVSGITSSALREQLRITASMETKKRRDTKVYKDLENTQVRLIQARLAVA